MVRRRSPAAIFARIRLELLKPTTAPDGPISPTMTLLQARPTTTATGDWFRLSSILGSDSSRAWAV